MSQPRTIAELRASGHERETVKQELRRNLLARLRERRSLFPGIVGYEETVIPQVANAVISGHDLILIQFLSGSLPVSLDLPFLPSDARPVLAQVILGLLLLVTVIFVPRGVIDFFGGQSRLSLAYLRRSLRETSV